MSITPQTIKDQEFQTKFRGYDTIEVKAYLDLIAEEFFDLLEAKRRQDEEVATLQNRCQELIQEKNEMELSPRARGSASTSDEERRRAREEEIRTLREQTATLIKQIKEVETEKSALLFARESRERALAEEVRDLRDKLMLAQQDAVGKDKDIESLSRQLTASEAQIGELKKDEMASKHLIIAAQNFADDLRRRSERDAREIMVKARAEVEIFCQKSQEELTRLPIEIERLHQQREQVRDELRHLLQTHLERLDSSSDFKNPDPALDEMLRAIGAADGGQDERFVEQDITVMDLEPPAPSDSEA